jgi:large subunit ribosomal protein L22
MAQRIDEDVQEARATAKFIRISPTKARQVIDLIRGRHVDDARRVLAFTSRAACAPVAKVLESAIANAEHNRALPADELVVTRTWVDEGPTLRRFRPRALGRATRIRKRTCHISVVVGRPADTELYGSAPAVEVEEERPRRKTTRKKTTARKTTESKSRKSTAKKTTAKKTTAKKTTAKKTTAKKTTAKKTAAKKTTRKKTTKKKSGEDA